MMRYAIPVSGSVLSPHFGHCEYFALIDVDERNNDILKKQLVSSPAHQPGLLPQWLADQGVSFVIAGGMGSRAQNLFAQSGIKVIVGALQTEPEEALIAYLQGSLAIGDNICDH